MSLFLCLLIGAILPAGLSLKPFAGAAAGIFLLLSGLELDLRGARSDFKLVARLWAGSFLPPFLAGLLIAALFPTLFPSPPGISPAISMVILAIAMAVSAVPVILKILQEVGLLNTATGRRIVLTATLCDLTAWLIFFPILPASGEESWTSSHLPLLMLFIGATIAFFAPQAHLKSRWLIGLNKWIAAPIFFISVGQRLDFTKGIDLVQILLVLVVAVTSKIFGVLLAARGSSLTSNDAKTIAISLNARGAMEILLAGLALQSGLIDSKLFTSLIVMAVSTSLIVKPLLRWTNQIFEKTRSLGS